MEIGTIVRIIKDELDHDQPFFNEIGDIVGIGPFVSSNKTFKNKDCYQVKLDSEKVLLFFESELEVVDDTRQRGS
ncbi:MAG TPA: hypothetical protein PKD55_02525 [Bellilinea sp.]|nr:hypothetical protein [Bellilinea sp.]